MLITLRVMVTIIVIVITINIVVVVILSGVINLHVIISSVVNPARSILVKTTIIVIFIRLVVVINRLVTVTIRATNASGIAVLIHRIAQHIFQGQVQLLLAENGFHFSFRILRHDSVKRLLLLLLRFLGGPFQAQAGRSVALITAGTGWRGC